MAAAESSEISSTEDEFSLSVGVAGQLPSGRLEVILMVSKDPDEQDIRLGHDSVYLEVDGIGGYGLIDKVKLDGQRSLEIHLLDGSQTGIGMEQSVLTFSFEEDISQAALADLRKVSEFAELRIVG